MDLHFNGTAFVRYVADCLGEARLTMIDIGCSGGIDPAWRAFGTHLAAFGFDPNLDECARLQAAESHPSLRYIPGFVGIRPDSYYASARGDRAPWSRNPWQRLSVQHSLDRLQTRGLSGAEKTQANLWFQTRLADPAAPVLLHEFLPAQGVADVDFIKIDVDGPDLGILDSLSVELSDWRVLGVGLEVNFFGSDDPTDHTLHATDRFMRAHGFDLFDLSVRRYSLAALPSPYLYSMPAQTRAGRPLQGDALYLRDPGAGLGDVALDAAKLLKLAAIAALAGVPDLAADILVGHRTGLAALIDVDRGLDLLAAQVQPNASRPLGYAAYMAAFARDDPMFYHGSAAASGEPSNPEAAAYHARLVAMEQSTSWRITAPLRWLAARLGRR